MNSALGAAVARCVEAVVPEAKHGMRMHMPSLNRLSVRPTCAVLKIFATQNASVGGERLIQQTQLQCSLRGKNDYD